MTIPEQLAAAIQHHATGNLAEAETIYRQILAQQHNHPDALHLLGVLAAQVGQFNPAIGLIDRAISINPNVPDFHNNRGNALRNLGRHDDAISAYKQAIILRSDYVEAYCNMAISLKNKGLLQESIAAYQMAALLKPSDPFIQNNLGNALWKNGKVDDAVAAYQKALELKPDFAEACNNLGNALKQKGMIENAIAAYRRALQLKPYYFEALCNLGNTLKETGDLNHAIQVYRDALRLKPDFPETHHDLGICLARKGELDEAIAAYRRAVDLNPNFASAHYSLAIALRGKNLPAEAVESCRRAIECQPDFADAHVTLAGLLLQQGDYTQGWPEYEWRWRATDFPVKPPKFQQPRWNGDPLNGQTIFIYTEQGIGDTIQFLRFIPIVASRGGRIILAAPQPLIPLLNNFPHINQLLAQPPWPPFDQQIPLLSLPLALKIQLESIPKDMPYLAADAGRIEAWRTKLPPSDGQLKVGLVWAGNPNRFINQSRSTTLSQLAPLAEIRNVTFHSLQKGMAAEQAKLPPHEMQLIDLSANFENFADTAALISHLDLVITVDTSVAHLAGAMGKPVWVLLNTEPDWRWGVEWQDSPWYPTMRLFRQRDPGDWTEVIKRVAESLAAYPHA